MTSSLNSSRTPIIKTFVIGLTGGIGSGKSAASDYFANLGIYVVDADVVAHDLTKKGGSLLQELADSFGTWVLDTDGNYNRSAMKDYLVAHPDAINKLNTITHPAIRETIIKNLQNADSPYTILAVPLLFETRSANSSLLSLCQHILVIDIPAQLQIERTHARGNQSLNHIQAIIAKQISRDERLTIAKKLNADIIENTGTIDELYAKLALLHERYLSLATTTQGGKNPSLKQHPNS